MRISQKELKEKVLAEVVGSRRAVNAGEVAIDLLHQPGQGADQSQFPLVLAALEELVAEGKLEREEESLASGGTGPVYIEAGKPSRNPELRAARASEGGGFDWSGGKAPMGIVN